MKKTAMILSVLLALVLAFSLVASAATEIIVTKKTPVQDGVISEGEYDTVVVLDGTTGKCWVEFMVTGAITFHLAFDDDALYIGAEIVDDCILYGNGKPADHDAFQIALNPNGVLTTFDQSLFFTFCMNEDGSVGALRHNYGVEAEEDEAEIAKERISIDEGVTGKAVLTATGYTVEVKMLWALVTDCKEFANFSPTAAPTPFTLTYMDRDKMDEDSDEVLSAAYMYVNGAPLWDFKAGTMPATLVFGEKKQEEPVDPQPIDPVEPTPSSGDEPTPSDGGTDEPAGIDPLVIVGICAAVIVVAVVVILITTRKKKAN